MQNYTMQELPRAAAIVQFRQRQMINSLKTHQVIVRVAVEDQQTEKGVSTVFSSDTCSVGLGEHVKVGLFQF